MPKEKVPYIPSSNKRFEVSPDEYSRTRLKFMRDLHQDLQNTFPFEIACSLYGSLTKGKKLDKKSVWRSDVDAEFYVDRDSILANFDGDKTPASLTQAYNLQIGRWDLAIGIHIPGIDTSKAPDNNAKIQLSERYILQRIKGFTKEHVKEFGYTMHNPPEAGLTLIRKEGDHSILDMIRRYEEAVKAGNEYQEKHWALRFSIAFQLDLGGHLKKYRQAFIEQLGQMDPTEADRLWGIVNAQIREGERQNNIPENLESQFPKTFKEAQHYYNPHGSQNLK